MRVAYVHKHNPITLYHLIMKGDLVKQRNHRLFIEIVEEFAEQILDAFPDCDDTQDALTLFRGTTKGNLAREDEMIQSWLATMKSPLVHKHVKYAKALERILDCNGCILHAVAYRDVEALQSCCKSTLFNKLKVCEKLSVDTVAQDVKDMVWRYVEDLNRAAFAATDESMPRVPSRDEINANIHAHKKKNPVDQGSILNAFDATFATLEASFGVKKQSRTIERKKENLHRWACLCTEKLDGVPLNELLQKRDPNAIPKLSKAFSFITSNVTLDAWDQINSLTSLAAVGNNIPTKMMGRIEDLANKLATDLMNGSAKLESLSLEDIGQQVLAGCEEEDMNAFAENLPLILPALQGFKP